MTAAARGFDRQAEIGDLAAKVRVFLKRVLPWIGGLLAVCSLRLLQTGGSGAVGFAAISGALVAVLAVWRGRGVGLPLLPMFVLQQFIAYALPILMANETLKAYSESDMDSAATEVTVFLLAIGIGWLAGMQLFRLAPPVSYALRDFQRSGDRKLTQGGFLAAGGATVLLLAQSAGLMDSIMGMLPNGSFSAINALSGAAASCGFFLLGMLLGAKQLKAGAAAAVWGMLFLNCVIAASAFLLSTVIFVLISITVGIFWTSGRVPWRFLIVVIGLLSFLNVGKYAMRDRYWHRDSDSQDPTPNFTLGQMPGTYGEWIQASIDGVTEGSKAKRPGTFDEDARTADTTGLLGRINNLQNLLYVIDAEQRLHIPPLEGETYTLIPALLVPRLLWPDKPRSHEGQVLLNVHFQRQDLVSTYSTYVAWGLLPEAYGNFGPMLGSILVGAVLGLFFAWAEKVTARKMVLSLEGFLAFTVFLGLANSVEMVASVLVPSIVQAIEPIVVAAMPFVTRTRIVPATPAPPAPEPAPEPVSEPPA